MARILSVIRIAASLNPCAWRPTPSPPNPWVGRYRAGRIPTIGRHDQGQGHGAYAVNASVASRMPLCSGDGRDDRQACRDKLLVSDDDCSPTITR